MGTKKKWEQVGVHFLGSGYVRGVLSELGDLLRLQGPFSGA